MISRRYKWFMVFRKILVLTIGSFLAGIYVTMKAAVWQPFVLSLGVSMTVLGLLEALGGFRGLIPALIQPLAGWFSDRIGRKLFIVLSGVLIIGEIFLYILAWYAQSWHLLVPAVAISGLSAISSPALSTMVAESVESKERGTAYSIITVFTMVPGIFASILGGFVADVWGFVMVFIIGIILEIICVCMYTLFLKETLHRNAKRSMEWSDFKAFFQRILVPEGRFRGFFGAMAADMFAWGLSAGILYGLLKKTFNFSNFQLGFLACLYFASWTVTQIPIGRLVDKYGCKVFLVLSELVGALLMVGWMTSTNFETFALLQIPYGVVASTWVPAMSTWLANKVPDGERAEAMGRLSAFRGIVGFLSPYMGGALYDSLGFWAPFSSSFVGITFSAILIILFVHEE